MLFSFILKNQPSIIFTTIWKLSINTVTSQIIHGIDVLPLHLKHEQIKTNG